MGLSLQVLLHGDLIGGLAAIILFVGNRLALEELFRPPQVEFGLMFVRGSRQRGGIGRGNLLRTRAGLQIGQRAGHLVHRCLGSGDFFGPGTGQQLRQGGLGGVQFRTPQVHVAAQIGRVEFGDFIALLDHLTFVDKTLLHAAREF